MFHKWADATSKPPMMLTTTGRWWDKTATPKSKKPIEARQSGKIDLCILKSLNKEKPAINIPNKTTVMSKVWLCDKCAVLIKPTENKTGIAAQWKAQNTEVETPK